MAHRLLVVALSAIAATAASAASTEPDPMAGAPAGTPETKYCLRVEPQTGSRLESVECWTREEWALGGVDVDKDWAKEGVKVLG